MDTQLQACAGNARLEIRDLKETCWLKCRKTDNRDLSKNKEMLKIAKLMAES